MKREKQRLRRMISTNFATTRPQKIINRRKRKARREAKRRAIGITFPFPKKQELRVSTTAPYSECPTESIRITPITFRTSVLKRTPKKARSG